MNSISFNQFDYKNLESWLNLDKENKPTDEVKFLQALDILLAASQDSADSPDSPRKLFTVAVLTSILSADVSYQISKKCNQIYKKIFSDDQPCYIKIGKGLLDLVCFKKNLTKGSKFFDKSLVHNVTDIEHIDKSCVIDLTELERWDKDILRSIISYLNERTPLDINQENFRTVVDLADFFEIESLKEDCFNFCKNKLTESNFNEVLDASYQIPSLRLLCVKFINANKNFQITDSNVKDKDSLNKVLQAIKTLLQKKSVLISSSFRGAVLKLLTKDSLKDILEIDSLFKSMGLSFQPLAINSLVIKTFDIGKITPEWSELIEFIKKHPEISTLYLKSKPAITQEQLNELSEILPNLNTLYIENDKITSIPSKILERVKQLSCYRCTSLIEVDAPQATRLSCDHCTSLTKLNAPQATRLYCFACTSLTKLNAPQATLLSCFDCTSLTKLNAPKATSASCDSCLSLTKLNAPQATVLSCFGTSLTELNAPKATTLSCHACTSLTKLNAPQATSLTCDGCISLRELDAPQAVNLFFDGCISLIKLNAPQATWLHSDRCISLTKLNAPQATRLYCNDCTSLTELNAPKATRLYCNDCTSLIELDAPQATWLHSDRCISLTKLNAPQATRLYCNDCTSLIELDAPKAIKLFSNGCTRLIKLNVPQATRFFML